MKAVRFNSPRRCVVFLAAAMMLGTGSARAQSVVWDGTTSLAATSLGGNTVGGNTTLSITAVNNHDFNATTVVNSGTVNWSAGYLRSGNGGTFTNASGAIFNLTVDGGVVNNAFGGTTAVFANNGTLNRNGTSAVNSQFDIPLNNTGTVAVTGGRLTLNGGGTSSGAFNVSGTGNDLVISNTYALTTGASLSGLVRVTAGTFTATGSIAVNGFSFEGGSLQGTQTFTGGTLTWSGGDWNAAATTTIASGATLAIASGAVHDFNAHAVANNGTVNWQAGAGPLRSGNSGTFTNNGTFNDAAANAANITANINNAYGGAASPFINASGATYTKTSAGATQFDVPFNNSGAVNVNAGTLTLNGGGTLAGAATITTAAGAQVVFSSNYTLANTASLTGAGTAQITAGTLSATGNITVSNFQFNGGNLAGTQTFTGGLTWNSGTWNDSGTTTTIASGATLNISSAAAHDFNTHAVANNGIVNWQAGAGPLRSGNAGSFTNNGTFNDAAANATNVTANINNAYGGTASAFTNASGATYTKTSAGTTQFDAVFNNNGTVNVNAGTLTLNGGGTLNGNATITAASGAQVVFSNNYTLANTSSLTGAGTAQITAGTLSATGNITVSNFQFNGGNLAGTQTFTGGLTWNSGTWNDSGTTTTIASGATLAIASSAAHDFNTHAVANNGTVNWQAGAGPLRSGNSGTFTNNGTFNDAAANAANITANINNAYGGTASAFINASGATYTKTSAGTTQFDAIFNNNGTVNVNAGTLTLNGGGTLNGSGTMSAASGATVLFSNNYTISNGASLTGAGAFQATAGTISVGGTVNVSNFQLNGATLAGTQTFNGNLTWNNGTLNDSSTTTTIGSGANLSIATGAVHDFNAHFVVNNGTATWAAGSGALRSGNSGTFTNSSLFIDAAASAASLVADINSAYGGTAFVFTNGAGATYRKTSAGTTTMSTPFVNGGLIDVQAGALQLLSTSTFNAGSSQTGAGLLQLASGTLIATGAMTFSNFQIAGGTVSGNQTFNGNIEWTNGNFNSSSATTTIGGTLTIDSSADHDFNAHVFVNGGTVNWIAGAGQIRTGNGGTFTNNGTFNDAASNNWNNAYGGTLAQFTNAATGIYNKSAVGTTTFSTAFVNAGTINARAGTLAFAAGGSSPVGAAFNVSTGATLSFTGGAFAVADGSGFTGPGTVQIAGATVNLGANIAAPVFQLTGGTLAGTQTFLGNLSWTGGNMNDSGTATTIGTGGTLTISSGADHDFNAHALVNKGTVTWATGAGQLRSGNSGSFTNQGVFNDAASSNMNNAYNGTASTFTNAAGGTYNKTAGTTTFNVPFTNNGTVNATGGTLVLANSGTIGNGAAFTGGGQTQLTGGTFTASGSFTSTGLVVAGATLNGTYALGGGTLTFTGGTLNGSAPTIAPGAALFYGSSANLDFNASTIVNNGTFNWAAGAGQLRSGNGGTFTNNSLFLDTASNQMNNAYGGAATTFINSSGGTYSKTAVGTTTVAIPFNNAGTVTVTTGSLVLDGGGTITAGANFNGAGQTVLDSGTFTASGLFNSTNLVLGGNAMLAGNTTLGGTFTWTSGNFNNSFTTTIAGGATFQINTAANHDFNTHSLVNQGTVNWTAGDLRSGNAGSFVNQNTGMFNDSVTGNINNVYNGTIASFTNSGLYNKTAGSTTVQIPFTNSSGVVLVSGSGTKLEFASSFTQTAGKLKVANGGTLQFDNNLNLAAGYLVGNGNVIGNVTSSGSSVISPSTGVASGNATPGQLNLTGNLSLVSVSTLLFALGGTAPGTGYDFLSVSGSATLGGAQLNLAFTNNFQTTVTSANTFTILTASSLSGAFANVANGAQLFTMDGLGKFTVNYGAGSIFAANSVVLSNFVPVPEPATWSLFFAGTGALALALRRRARR